MNMIQPIFSNKMNVMVALLLFVFLLGCRQQDADLPTAVSPVTSETPASPGAPTALPTAVVPTPIPPTPTPTEPLAATVNGEQIFLATYERLLTRFEQSNPNSTIDYRPITLDALIDNTLIRQAAQNAGHAVTPEQIDQQMATLIEAAGGQENFDAWLASNVYTNEEMRQEVAFGLLSAPLLTEIANSVPTTSEQVHARYIKVTDEALATALFSQLQNGADFATLANQNSIPELIATNPNGGDVGFFGMTWPLEGVAPNFAEVAFSLEPGQISSPFSAVEADGVTYYYIVQSVAKEIRPLPPQLLDQRRQEAIVEWTQALRQNAEIAIFVETGVE